MIPEGFIVLNLSIALQIVLLGFIGGVLSGFIGSGGAFFMTPGMMNLGVAGAIAVGSNTAHKFGKALMGARAHREMGHVDSRLAWCMLVTAAIGNSLAVWINAVFFGATKGHGGSAAGDLYISLIFVIVLLVVALAILRDALKHHESGEGPSIKLAEFFGRIRIPPVIHFRVADVTISAWVIGVVGLATGYLAGTIGVGGFIGVPAMIYIFGIPSVVAAGTELYLAMFMGAWLAISYAWYGAVDIRLVLLMYLGSLTGIYVGAYGTRVVKEKIIRLVTGMIILLCVFSRAIAIPVYLRQLNMVNLPPESDVYFNQISKILLFASGIFGVVIILYFVTRAYIRRQRVEATMRRV
jgi:uncharacterized protein